MARTSDYRRVTAEPEKGATPDPHLLTPEQKALLDKRAAVYDGFLALGRRPTKAEHRAAAEILGIQLRTSERLWATYKIRGYRTALLPLVRPGGRGKPRLPARTEYIIERRRRWYKRNRPNAKDSQIIQQIRIDCEEDGTHVASPNAIRARLNRTSARQNHSDKYGAKKAHQKFKVIEGKTPATTYPLERVQIDHTLVDVVCVSEYEREFVGRPWITIAIDEHTRAILGFVLSYEYPSAATVAMCLTRAVLPKEAWLKRLGVESEWPMRGIMDSTYTDNGADFRSVAMATGCEEWLMRPPEFRPKGSPQFGGIIERLIGTIMQQMRLLPGSTAKEWKDRGVTANPNETAQMTIDELERDIATFITGIYHKKRHSSTKQQPELAWERGINGTEKKPGRGKPRLPSDPLKFFLDFLERKTRTIQKYGIKWDKMDYRHDLFQKYVDNDDGRSFYVCRNPYDVSHIYWKEEAKGQWIEVKAADIAMPRFSLAELHEANRLIEARGDKSNNESIKAAVLARRKITQDATAETARVRGRRNNERHRKAGDLAQEFSPRHTTPVAAVAPSDVIAPRPAPVQPPNYRTDIIFEVD